MEIVELLMRSSDNMRAAHATYTTFLDCRIEIVKKLYKAINEKLHQDEGEKTFERLVDKKWDWEYSKALDKFDHPSISYIVRSDDEGYVVLSIEIGGDGELFVGIGFAGLNKERINKKGSPLFTTLERRHVPADSQQSGKWYSCWANLEINFALYDCNYFKLFDNEYFIKEVDRIVECIIGMKESLLAK